MDGVPGMTAKRMRQSSNQCGAGLLASRGRRQSESGFRAEQTGSVLSQTLGNWRGLVQAGHGTRFVHTDECVKAKLKKNWSVAVLRRLGEAESCTLILLQRQD